MQKGNALGKNMLTQKRNSVSKKVRFVPFALETHQRRPTMGTTFG